ncbi:MAG: Jag N-terminal domain-containing protein [Acidimicrobiia bacterium]|nr:Jag N-terminal domain-containing protein [Acidimicrobiia bacterium]
MEWVEITAPTVEAARDGALDQLGVDEQDAEIEVLEEPRAGLFGRLRGQARVRARVKPLQARPKVERRDRRSRSKVGDKPAAETTTPSGDTVATADGPNERVEAAAPASEAEPRSAPRRSRGGRGSSSRDGSNGGSPRNDTTKGNDMPDLSIDEQADVVAEFLTGLAGAFGFEGTSTTNERVEEDTIEVRLEGGDLGLLIGPKGQTLQLVQELARTAVQRRGGGTQEGRIRIDVAGYRQRRREALERFTRQVAADVVSSGALKALEPMNPADRKVVHDTVNDIEGVRTLSEGEEPRRRVVLLPG